MTWRHYIILQFLYPIRLQKRWWQWVLNICIILQNINPLKSQNTNEYWVLRILEIQFWQMFRYAFSKIRLINISLNFEKTYNLIINHKIRSEVWIHKSSQSDLLNPMYHLVCYVLNFCPYFMPFLSTSSVHSALNMTKIVQRLVVYT